jgi:hypothetical protein
MSVGALRHHVNSGRWQLAHRAVFVAHNGPISPTQRRWIAALAVGNGRVAPLAGLTALDQLGLRGFASGSVHVLLPQHLKGATAPAGVAVHRTRTLPRRDYHDGLPPCTAAARSVVDAASWAPSDDRARAIVAAAFQQRMVTFDQVNAVISDRSQILRRGLIAAAARDAAGGSESISELDFLDLCRSGRLPLPTRQSVVVDVAGRRRKRDAFFEQWRVHVEIDGSQHMDVVEWWADMQRQNDMWTNGDRVLRFPAWAIRHEPERVIAQIRAALLAAGWRP